MDDSSSKSGLIAVVAFILAFVIGIPVGLVLLLGGGGAAEQQQQQAACGAGPGGAALVVNVDEGSLPNVDGFSKNQVSVAAVIMTVAEELKMGSQGQLVALITAMQESDLGDDPTHTQPDENQDAGVFQQRVIPGWYGTLQEVNDPSYGARIFFEGKTVSLDDPKAAGPVGYHIPGLKNVSGWENMEPGDAAQEVQRSAFPDAYDKHIGRAQKLMEALSGTKVSVATSSSAGASDGGGAAGCIPGEYKQATDFDSLPQFPMPEGCTDQTPLYSEPGPGTLNGNVPDSALCKFPGNVPGDGRGQARAVAGFVAMNEAFRNEFGHDITITSTYRTYQAQVRTKKKRGKMAATPGYSNHGFGLAVDLGGTTKELRWIQQNGPGYGWWHPLWARPNGSKPEHWHYEYGTWLVEKRYANINPDQIAY